MKKMKKRKINVLTLINVVLTGSLAWNVLVFFINFADYRVGYPVDDSELLTHIKYSDYQRLLERSFDMDEYEINNSATMKECYYIAQYYENAILFKAYEGIDGDKENIHLTKMNEAKSYVSEFYYTIDEINEMLLLT